MLDLLKKSMTFSIGLAVKTKEEIEELAKEFMHQGKMSEQEGNKFMDDMLRRYEDSKKSLENKVEKIVRDILKKSDIASLKELEALKQEVRELKDKLASENKS
jgi:polyhydroxyalkanoate synthesis regulator phasin